MADKVKFKKGLKASIPTTLESGTYYQCTDTGELYLATSTTEKVLVKDSSKIPNTREGLNSAINLLDLGGSDPVDADYYISQYVNGGTSNTTYYRRPMSKLWNYIKSKIDAAKYYIKPDAGIPKTDLASAVQTSLGKADTALQSHQDISGKVNVANVNISNQTTTILALTKALVGSTEDATVHYRRWYSQSDGGSSKITDKPGDTSSATTSCGFVCEAILKRYCGEGDYVYELKYYKKDNAIPYYTAISQATTSITWYGGYLALPLSGGTMTGTIIGTSSGDAFAWKPQTNINCTATANGQEWSFDIRKGSYTGCYWHVWDSSKGTLLKANADDGIISAPYGFSGNVTGNCSGSSGSCTGNSATATKSTSSVCIEEPQKNNEVFTTFINTNSNIHHSSLQGEFNLYRFFAKNDESNYSTKYGYPCVDSHSLIFSIDSGANYIRALNLDIRTADIYTRLKLNGTWGDWIKLLNSSNYTNYTVKKDGTGASGSWGISVTGSSASCTGNAASATKATQDGSGNTITSTYATNTALSTAVSGAVTSANGYSDTKFASGVTSIGSGIAAGGNGTIIATYNGSTVYPKVYGLGTAAYTASTAYATAAQGAKADTALQSHQSVTDNNPTLAWSTKSKVATIGSTEINVTMPANPNTDSKVTQTNTTTSAWNRLLLSANANDTTETNTSYKSGKFLANPNNGEFRIYSTSTNCLSLYRQTTGAGVYINYFNNNQSALYWRVGVVNTNNFIFSYIDSSGEKLKMLLDTSGNASFTGGISVGATSSDVTSVTKPVTMQYNSTDASLDFIFA